jgi:hypothetical protein
MACGRSGRGGRGALGARRRTCCVRRGRSPRRRDCAEVIGEALALAAAGAGHRRDRPAAGSPAGDGPWMAARRQDAGGEPARVRGQIRLCAGPGRADRGHPGRQRARRRGRGDHARRPRAGVALRTSEDAPDRAWELAVCITGGLLGGPATAPAVSPLAWSCASATSSPPSRARRLRVKRRSHARLLAASVVRRLTPADGAATPAGARPRSRRGARSSTL